MVLRATLSIAILLLGLGPAPAHVPEGTARGIWQWPLDALPVMDGDPADLTVRVAVGWNDETDRLYFAQQRHDDLYDRDGFEPPAVCTGDDHVEIHVDADHSGGLIKVPSCCLSDDGPEPPQFTAPRRS